MPSECGHCPDHVDLVSNVAVIKSTVLRLENMAKKTEERDEKRQERDEQFAIDIAVLQHDAVEEGGKAGRRGGTMVAAIVTGGLMGIVHFIKWLAGAA